MCIRPSFARFRRLCAAALLLAVGALSPAPTLAQKGPAYGPGDRVLLDAHNAYPYEGRHADRLDRALATGIPLAIEQDLIWRVGADGRGESVVEHDVEDAGGAPTLEQHFFERLRPLMEKALKDDAQQHWPLVVLNLDFKTVEPAHLDAVWELLGQYESWLTTAPRTGTPEKAEPMTVGPLLVLTGSSAEQARRFHDAVPVGQRLRLFGAIDVPAPQGDDPAARAAASAAMPVNRLIGTAASNYRRWVNFPWGVIEAGGPTRAGAWTEADAARLRALVARAHAQHLWIRFYTLNGHPASQNQGWSETYNFGSERAARLRWRAARRAGVDFIATDQYEAFVKLR